MADIATETIPGITTFMKPVENGIIENGETGPVSDSIGQAEVERAEVGPVPVAANEENSNGDINGHSEEKEQKENGHTDENKVDENGTNGHTDENKVEENGTNGHTDETNVDDSEVVVEAAEEPVVKKAKKNPKAKDLKAENRRSSSRLVNLDAGSKLSSEISSDNLKHLK